MELLTTHVSYTAAVLLSVVFGIVLVVGIKGVFEKGVHVVPRVLSGIIVLLALSFLVFVWADPQYVTYDAIITDWNVVHDQGYEVIEQNGKIVTLRKVGD